jgi:hypothetical protein
MTSPILSLKTFALGAVLAGLSSIAAPAATITFNGLSSDGHAVAAKVQITPNAGADTLALKLTNTTAITLDAGELFTGLDFSLGGLTPSLTSAQGNQRTVTGVGALSDTGSPQNLSWSVASLGGGNFQLNFNPNAADSIIGPPSGGDYSGANGSVKGNAGHNPFAAETAEFVLSVPGLEAHTSIAITQFRFGTTLAAATGNAVPEPGLGLMALSALAGFSGLRFGRRPSSHCPWQRT